MMTIDGEATNPADWKCMTVSSLAAAPSGWSSTGFDDSAWGAGAVRNINAIFFVVGFKK